jgi:UDP:flavonoid glycosyltransferase YjiC (YdhE family)
MQIHIHPFTNPIPAIKYKAGMPLFIRYGLWGKYSHNFSTGIREKGVSVYKAIYNQPTNTIQVNDETCHTLNGQQRLCFPVTGKVIGMGSDGEPVLSGVKMVVGPAMGVESKR